MHFNNAIGELLSKYEPVSNSESNIVRIVGGTSASGCGYPQQHAAPLEQFLRGEVIGIPLKKYILDSREIEQLPAQRFRILRGSILKMTARKEWSREETFNLISIYKKNSVLWDVKDSEYKNRDRKNKIIQGIAANFQCSTEEIQRKMHNLRNQMSQELRKMVKKKLRSGSDEVDVSNWPYFTALNFLIPVLCMNTTQSPHTQASMSIVDKTNETQEYATEKNAESEEEEKKILSPQYFLKRKRDDGDIKDNLFKLALETLVRQPDDYDKFGQYVALELRTLKSDFSRARLKSEIRKIIVRIADEDLYGTNTNTSFISNTEMIMKTSIPCETELLSPQTPDKD